MPWNDRCEMGSGGEEVEVEDDAAEDEEDEEGAEEEGLRGMADR